MMENNGKPIVKGIFLLFEGLPKTIIESQVIGPAVGVTQHGIDMEVWSFAVTTAAYNQAISALPAIKSSYQGLKIRVFRGIKPAIPFSEYMNALLLYFYMLHYRISPQFVHARTENAAMIAALVKMHVGFKLVWDARGDTVSEFMGAVQNLPKYLKPFWQLKMRAIKKRLKVAQKRCDFAFFVSNALRELQGPDMPEVKSLVLPCLADESKFYFDSDLRSTTRAKLAIREEDVVFIYVGSTAYWQCVPETISLIENVLSSRMDARAIIITPNVKLFKSLINSVLLHRVFVQSASHNEVNAYLNAADYGILLRHKNQINWVASPVKFAEYCLSGLSVIADDAIEQINEYGSIFGNLIHPKELTGRVLNQVDDLERKRLALEAREYLSMSSGNSLRANCYKSLTSSQN
ncbi:MAG: hypothetical protein ACOYB2_03140 [Limnohabitans sp.]